MNAFRTLLADHVALPCGLRIPLWFRFSAISPRDIPFSSIPDPRTPAPVHLVAARVREPNVPGDKVSTVSFQSGIVVRRGCPSRQRRRFRLEIAPPLVAVAHRHLAAEFEDLATLRHLNEDTACAELSQLRCERLSPDRLRPCRFYRHAVLPSFLSAADLLERVYERQPGMLSLRTL